jgi:hypothetical protein
MQSQLQQLQERLDQLEQQKGRTADFEVGSPPGPVRTTGQASEGLQAQRLLDSVRAEASQQHESAALQVTEDAEESKRDSIKDRYTELFRLHDEGKSMDAISKQTGIQLGEVQLILQLAEREES